jgi:hypothetical protein
MAKNGIIHVVDSLNIPEYYIWWGIHNLKNINLSLNKWMIN